VEGISDKVFTTDMLDYLRSHYCVDDSRIYATGKSNGGGFVNLLACSLEHGGDFAAFAIAAGAFYENYTETCKPARSPLPILEFHGSADMTIPYVGNTKRYLPPVPDWLAQWADRNGCTQSTNISEIDDRVYHTSYCGVTQAYLVEGMHHCWPSTEFTHENKHCGNQTKPDTLAPIEATSIMMNFFDMYTKPDITTAETDLDEAQVEMHKELF
jgi:poly(3-hydroxybutyrate) depolymerase